MSALTFKTNISCSSCRQPVANALNSVGEAIRRNTDLDDCDRVLRVETSIVSTEAIIRVLNESRFVCEELA